MYIPPVCTIGKKARSPSILDLLPQMYKTILIFVQKLNQKAEESPTRPKSSLT